MVYHCEVIQNKETDYLKMRMQIANNFSFYYSKRNLSLLPEHEVMIR